MGEDVRPDRVVSGEAPADRPVSAVMYIKRPVLEGLDMDRPDTDRHPWTGVSVFGADVVTRPHEAPDRDVRKWQRTPFRHAFSVPNRGVLIGLGVAVSWMIGVLWLAYAVRF